MKRNVSIEEISDGRLYTSNDLVKADCGGCRGCSVCCHGMGTSVILDPLDAARLAGGLNRSVEELIGLGILELNVVDGVILPNLRMAGEDEACVFLNEEGRCSVHAFRPGICRLFPLGRYYHPLSESSLDEPAGSADAEGISGKEALAFRVQESARKTGSASEISRSPDRIFSYFLQVRECPYPAKTKVKVRKWIDTPDIAKYERYIAGWHCFLEDTEELLKKTEDDQQLRNINLYLLKFFYLKPYKTKPHQAEPRKTEPGGNGDFYQEFYGRLREAREVLAFPS